MTRQASVRRSAPTAPRTPATGNPAADLQRGVALHQAGELDQAEAAYRAVLQRLPHQADALHLLGVVHHQRGDSRKAVSLIQRAIKIDDSNAHALVNLGAALQALDRRGEAEAAYRRALARLPDNAEALANLAAVRQAQGDAKESVELLAKAVSLAPGRAPWLLRLADQLFEAAQYQAAAPVFAAYLALVPDDPKVANNYGVALEKLKRYGEAAVQYRRMIAAHPELAEGHANLGNALAAMGQGSEAEESLRRAVQLSGGDWRYRISLANLLLEIARIDEGRALYDAVLAERPQDAHLLNELGARLVRGRRLSEAVEVLRQVVAIDPNFAGAYNNLGNALTELHRWEEALPALQEAIRLAPDNPLPRLNIVQLLQKMQRWDEALAQAYGLRMSRAYQPELCDGRLLQAFKDICDFDSQEDMAGFWDVAERIERGELASVALTLLALADDEPKLRRFTGLMRKLGAEFAGDAMVLPLPPLPALPPLAGRKLRIGFLSSDLRTHSVAKFVLPLFKHYDRERFEMIGFSGYPEIADPVQAQIRGLLDGFHYINRMTDREAAQAIRDAKIDILFDLGGYTAHSRLPVLTYRAAPIQVEWLGWPFTTGISQVDYFLVDHLTRPTTGEYMVEKPLEVSGAFVCFESFPDEPIGPSPFEANGHITFGTLNSTYKYSRRTIARWAEVMRGVPGSRMVIVRPEAGSLAFLDNLVREFERNGVTRDRLDIIDNRKGSAGHLSYYNLFDISLDTFPVTGGTTTTDALWMGVPVVSLVGPAYHQRIGGGVAKHCGLADLCVETPDAFVRVAIALANDRPRLAALRQSLRAAMQDSALCRVDKFIAGFETALIDVAQRHLG